MDPVVLSYQDSLLRRSDVALLEGANWLNDRIIGFAFEYFAATYKGLHDTACFISPEVTQFIKCASCQEELALFLEPLALPTRSWVFLAVNDNLPQSAGGSHWSLLLFQRHGEGCGRFAHFDSQSAGNAAHARRIATRLEPFLGAGRKVTFTEELCATQENSYDCGMYVVCHAEALCEGVGTVDEGSLRQRANAITPAYITRKRVEWVRLIQRLAKE